MKAINTPKSPGAGGFKIHDVLYVVFKHKRKIIAFTLLGALIAAVFGYRSLVAPSFETQAKLLIRYVVERNTSDPEGPDRVVDAAITTEIEILQSLDLAIDTARRFGPEKLIEGDHSHPPAAENAAGRIMAGLLAEQGPSGNVIYITYRDNDPEMAVKILQNHIQTYFARHLKIHRSTEAFQQVATQTAQAQDALRKTEEEINRIKSNSGVLAIESTIAEFESRRQVMRGLLMAAEATLAEQMAKVQALEKSYAARNPKDTGKGAPKPEKLDDELERRKTAEAIAEYQDLVSKIEVLQKERNQLLVRRPSHDPMVSSLDRQISAAQRMRLDISTRYPDIVGKIEKGVDPMQTGTLEDERALQKAIEARVSTIAKQVKSIEGEVEGLSALGFKLEGLERRRTMEDDKYRMFQTRLEKARLDETLDPSRIPNIVVLQNPSAPMKSLDDKTKFIILGLAGSGMMLGVGLAFLKEWVFDRRISRPTEIQAKLQMPLMLSIPFIHGKAGRLAIGEGPLALPDHGSSRELAGKEALPEFPSHPAAMLESSIAPFAAAIHDRIIFNFQINNINHKPKLIALTSPSPGAGVSTIASSLAKAFSADGNRKVLLVDMNAALLNAPKTGSPADSLHRAIDIAKNQHFRESLRNLYFASAPMRRDAGEGRALTPFNIHEEMPNLLASEFDYVIFDMPCVDPTSPTLSVAGFMDKVLLVVDGEKTTREDLSWAYSELEKGRADVSCIYNKARTHAPRWVEAGA